jgi:hypothetical protein
MDILNQLASGGGVVTVIPQPGSSASAAAAAIAGVADQTVNKPNKEVIIVDGPMKAGKTPENVAMSGTTYSHQGAPVEAFLTFYLDGSTATETGVTVTKSIFDAFGNNACRSNCGNSNGLIAANANFRVYGETINGCDTMQAFIRKLSAGQSYDIHSMKVEDMSGNVSKDIDYTLLVHRYNFNGEGSSAPLRLGDMLDTKQYHRDVAEGSVTGHASKLDGDTAWDVPVKSGKKLKITLRIVKRYQY